jgi:polyphosphate kinase 2
MNDRENLKSENELDKQLAATKEEIIQLKNQLSEQKKINAEVLHNYNQLQELIPYQAELIQLQKCLERRGKKMIILFEGRGGAGKQETIKIITEYMNAKHYRVIALGKPTPEERSQWYFQRYVKHFPRAGEMLLFDRSWYTRALIEPVFDYCSEQEYEDFMEGVDGFEKDLTEQGIILIKLYFSVSREEQARRFARRRNDPLQSWKLKEIDVDAEEYRDKFTELKYEMLKRTHTLHAPWTIIRSDTKQLARLNAIKVILNQMNYEPLYPELDITLDRNVVVSGAFELEKMKAQRIRLGLPL